MMTFCDRVRVNRDRLQPLCDRLCDGALPALAYCLVEAGIDDEIAVLPDDGPDEIIERPRGIVVRVAVDEIHRRRPVMAAISDGIDFVRVAHAGLPQSA